MSEELIEILGALFMFKGVGKTSSATSEDPTTYPQSEVFDSEFSVDNPPKPYFVNSLPVMLNDMNSYLAWEKQGLQHVAKEQCFPEILKIIEGVTTVPNKDEVVAWYEKVGKVFGFHPALIRAVERHESGQTLRPFSQDIRSTALGTGSILLGTANGKVPWIWLVDWRVSAWGTARILRGKKYPSGAPLPTGDELLAMPQFAGTPDEDPRYKAMRAYYSLAVDMLAASSHNATLKLNTAITNQDTWQKSLLTIPKTPEEFTRINNKMKHKDNPGFMVYALGAVSKWEDDNWKGKGRHHGKKALAMLYKKPEAWEWLKSQFGKDISKKEWCDDKTLELFA